MEKRISEKTGQAATKQHKGTGRPAQHAHAGNSGSGEKRPLAKFRSLILFPAVLMYDELMLRAFSGNGVFSHFGYLLIFTLSCALFFTGFITPFKRKMNRRIALILIITTQAFFATECVIHGVFATYMAPSNLFSAAGNVAGNYGGQMFRSIFFSLPKIALFLLPAILFGKLGKKYVPTRRYIPAFSAGLIISSLLLLLTGALFASHGSSAAVYGAQFDYNKATDIFGLMTSTRLSFKYRVFGNNHASFKSVAGDYDAQENRADEAESTGEGDTASASAEAVSSLAAPAAQGVHKMEIDLASLAASSSGAVKELTSYIESLTPSPENDYTGLFAGKNLILISAEAYSSAFLTPELTPTLWRLTHNGFYFSEYYQPEWGGSTTTGELSYLVGLTPRDGDESMIRIAKNNNYFTLGNQLQRLGYSSCAFHNGSISYYQRNNTHTNLGYNQFIGNQNGMEDLTGCDYCHDGDMVDLTMDKYLDKQPFSIYYMTISGHAPYEEDSELVAKYIERVDEYVGDLYEETTKYYICYQMELERAMTIMVKKLEDAGIADDTVIVLVGDHFPYGLRQGEAWGNDGDYLADLMKSDHSLSWQQDRNGLIIWSGCLEHAAKDMQCEISSPVFSLDIVPTLLNLFGLTYDSRLLPGRDVFSDAMPLVFWNNLSWVTERGRYDSESGEYYPREGYGDDPSYTRYIETVIENKILLSRTIMENDYYGLLFGPDDVTFAGKQIFPMTEEEREAEEEAHTQTDPYYTGVESYEGDFDDFAFSYEGAE